MQKDAEMHAGEDQKKREAVEAKNIAEQMIYTSEKALKDAGDKVSADIRKGVEDKIADLKQVKDGSDLAKIKSATEALSTELSKVGEAMNKASQTSGATGTSEKKDGEGPVRDAEFKEGDKK
jgi:molecular chaperone DnaK